VNTEYLQGFSTLNAAQVQAYEFDEVADTTGTQTGLREAILLVLAFHETLEISK
jgi:hypothetical protein